MNKNMDKSLTLLALLLALTVSSSLNYDKLINEIDPEAKCLDGSAPPFYLHQGGDTKKLLIYFSRSQVCGFGLQDSDNYLECLFELSQSRFGSSEGWFDPYDGAEEGIISTDPAKSNFASWTKLVILPCDGAFNQGYTQEPYELNDQKIWLRGSAITRAHFKWLDNNYGLEQAENIVLAGASSGGVATYLWIEHLKSLVSQPEKVQGIIGSGALFFPPIGIYNASELLGSLPPQNGRPAQDSGRGSQMGIINQQQLTMPFEGEVPQQSFGNPPQGRPRPSSPPAQFTPENIPNLQREGTSTVDAPLVMPQINENLLSAVMQTREILDGVDLPDTIFGRRQANLIAALQAFSQGGFQEDLDQFGQNNPFRDIWNLSNVDQGLPNTACTELLQQEEAWKCLYLQYAYAGLSDPVLVVGSLYDTLVQNVLPINCTTESVSRDAYTLTECEDWELAIFEAYRANFQRALLGILALNNHSIWYISCGFHAELSNSEVYNSPDYKVPEATGRTMRQAVEDFVGGQSFQDIDGAKWPQNTACAL